MIKFEIISADMERCIDGYTRIKARELTSGEIFEVVTQHGLATRENVRALLVAKYEAYMMRKELAIGKLMVGDII